MGEWFIYTLQILKVMAEKGITRKIKGMFVDEVIHHGNRLENQMDAKLKRKK